MERSPNDNPPNHRPNSTGDGTEQALNMAEMTDNILTRGRNPNYPYKNRIIPPDSTTTTDTLPASRPPQSPPWYEGVSFLTRLEVACLKAVDAGHNRIKQLEKTLRLKNGEVEQIARMALEKYNNI